jgi:uncharacterized protein (TIGR03086 family)
MSDDGNLFFGATDAFGARLATAGDAQWSAPTPDTDWDVRALVSHVVGEVAWMPPLLRGQTIAEIGDRFEGDLLGADPKKAWTSALAETRAAIAEVDPQAIVHLSYGDVPAQQYIDEVGSDILIHSWDLARGIGADDQLPAALVDRVATWFAGVEDMWRSAGAIGPRVPVPDGADAQTRLLSAFGRAS